MSKSVFVSYRRTEGEWVLSRLVPCLRAGGADVCVDVERFKAGRGILGQMDAEQDASDINLLVLSQDYFQSDYCFHEFKRALKRDPHLNRAVFLPVLRDDVDWQLHVPALDRPLAVDLRDDDRPHLNSRRHLKIARRWNLLLEACRADLGCDAPEWLRVRDEVVRELRRNQSVNLVVQGKPKWEELLVAVRSELESAAAPDPGLAIVDLEDPETATRRALVAKVLDACGLTTPVPRNREELVMLKQALSGRPMTRLALLHFDLVQHHKHYDVPFFAALRHLTMDHALDGTPRRLVVLIQSRKPFLTLLPREHPLSEIQLTTVGLRGRTK